MRQKENYYTGVCGIILVFDVTDKQSFSALSKYWIPILNETLNEPFQLLVLGNKTDKLNDRVISEQDAREFIEKHPDLQVNPKKTKKDQALQLMQSISHDSKGKDRVELNDRNSQILGKQYIEVSAMDLDSIDNAFKYFIGEIINQSELHQRLLKNLS